jgi:inner membrane protein
MVFWHLGLAALVTYVSLGRSRIDYRFVLAGAILPDVVDGLLGLVVFSGPSGRWIAHSLLAVMAVFAVIVVAFKGERRVAVFGLGVGWLLHLVGDGMWQAPRTFLWPAFGPKFAAAPAEPYSWDLFADPAAHLWTWAGELAGILVLLWFFVAFRLGEKDRRTRFLRDGLLRA